MFTQKNNKNIFDWLKKQSDFERVFRRGRTIISDDKKLKARYLFLEKTESLKVKSGISIISKKGNSVWRNRFKRILRESLRRDTETLIAIAKQKNSNLLIIFSPYSIDHNNFSKIHLNDIADSMQEILKRLKELAIT